MSQNGNKQPRDSEARDRRVRELYEQVLEIEERLIPTGLHVFGRVPGDEAAADLLRMIASFDRPEAGARSLPDLVAESLRNAETTEGQAAAREVTAEREAAAARKAESMASAATVVSAAEISTAEVSATEVNAAEVGTVEVRRTEVGAAECKAAEGDAAEKSLRARERVDGIVRESIRRFLVGGVEEACRWLETKARVEARAARPTFELLAKVRAELLRNQELDSFARALRGEYVEPGPGADIVQNPAVLPTGRNTHAVNPYAVPSGLAFARAERVVNLLLERHAREHGRHPRAMALVLWGLDNIKTGGEGVAQALWLLGVRPLRDAMNRVTDVEPIPLERLGRPRIDVVMTVSGIFRDLFAATTLLLDKAVRLVASLDEPPELNYLRANVLSQAASGESDFDEAATRVFSNAPGSYGTNVNFMVMDSQWERAETLGDLFVTRKCFAYGRDSRGRSLEGREAGGAMRRALSRVEAAYQNIDSFEIGITDVDHYFEYLGGVSKAVERHAERRPAIYLSDSLSREAKVRSLAETVRLETRAKTLNPKWYEGMLGHGFRGVAEIESRVTNTFGWSATADAVDGWVYDEVAETFVLDEEMIRRLSELNPHSARALVGRLLEAEARGFWKAEEAVVERLREVFAALEDRLEGVA